MITSKKNFCIQCGNIIETSFQTKFCSRDCWENYKKDHSLTVAPERQATIFIKTSITPEETTQDEEVRLFDKEWKPLHRNKHKTSLEYEKIGDELVELKKRAQNQQTEIQNKDEY